MTTASGSAATTRSKLLWTGFLLFAVWVYGGGFRTALSSHTRVGDFFQEWASARNYFEGVPVYTPQEISAWNYLRYRPSENPDAIFCRINGHPPTSVLPALPLAKLPYEQAFLIWNVLSIAALVASIAIVLKLEFGTAATFRWMTLIALLISNPLMQHLMLGQLGLFLLALIMAAAWAESRGRSCIAAALVGAAAAMKMFPAYLFLYFLVNRRWKALVCGGAAFAAWHGLALGLFGVQTYRDWIEHSLPEVAKYRDFWGNYSLAGFWCKLFDGSSGQTIPWTYSPTAAKVLGALSFVVVTAICGWCLHRGRGKPDAQRSGLALCLTAMVLCAPIAWDHYLLLLIWPLTHLAVRIPAGSASRALLNMSIFAFWLNPLVPAMLATADPHAPMSTMATLALLSWPTYGLVVTFALGAIATLHESRSGERRSTGSAGLAKAER